MIALMLFLLAGLLPAVIADTPQQRAQNLLNQMELSEKLDMLHGHPGIYIGNVPANTRLGIPALNLNDGPQGFRTTGGSDRTGPAGSTTAWPTALTVSSSWDTDLALRWAEAMGEEFRDKGANIALAPGVGFARVPTAGRNFEYLCGEDPVLGSRIVEQVIVGEGVCFHLIRVTFLLPPTSQNCLADAVYATNNANIVVVVVVVVVVIIDCHCCRHPVQGSDRERQALGEQRDRD